MIGAMLDDGTDHVGGGLRVTAVVHGHGEMIMPLTRTGRILAASASGAPVLAATLNKAQLPLLHSSGIWLPPFLTLYSYLFPAAFEGLEPMATRFVGQANVKAFLGNRAPSLPLPLKIPAIIAIDAVLVSMLLVVRHTVELVLMGSALWLLTKIAKK